MKVTGTPGAVSSFIRLSTGLGHYNDESTTFDILGKPMLKPVLEIHSSILKRLSLATLMCVWTNCIHAQGFFLEKIPNELGLSQNMVRSITQDTLGFMWMGTPSGLNRFDGYEFKIYRSQPNDSLQLYDNNVLSVHVDSRGWLWVASAKGLQIFDFTDERFYPVIAKRDILVDDITEDPYGNIWCMASDLKVHRIEPGTSIRAADHRISSFDGLIDPALGSRRKFSGLEIDDTGSVWISTINGIWKLDDIQSDSPGRVRLYDFHETSIFTPPADWKVEQLDQNPQHFEGLYQARHGGLWLLFENGVGRYVSETKEFSFTPVSSIENGDHLILDQISAHGFEDEQGNLWIGGLMNFATMVYDTRNKALIEFSKDRKTSTFKEVIGGIIFIYEDRSGVLWFGTNGRGLFKYNPRRSQLSSPPNGILCKGKSRYNLFEAPNGLLWQRDHIIPGESIRLVETFTGVEKHAIIPGFEFSDPSFNTPEGAYVCAFAHESDTTFWAAGTRELYLIEVDGEEIERITHHPVDLVHESHMERFADVIKDIYRTSDGDIWVLSGYEFGKYNFETHSLESKTFIPSPPTEMQHPITGKIVQQNDTVFWIGNHHGLFRYSVNNREFTAYHNDAEDIESLSSSDVKSLCLDPLQPQKFLWVGTAGNGLNRLDIESGLAKRYSSADGLPDEVIYGILGDNSGHIWFSTNKGLCRMDVKSSALKVFTQKDGLQDMEFNGHSYAFSNDGRLMFGGIGGYNVFWADSLKDSDYNPNVVFTQLSTNAVNVDFRIQPEVIPRPISACNEIVLTHQERMFTLDFAALDFSEPEKNQYAYWMVGFDSEWQEIGNRRSMTFTNLDPGDYQFKVKATNSSGVWSENEAVMSVRILPPWWATWWAYTIYSVILLSIVLLLYRYQLKRRLAGQEARRLRELDTLKSRLYANITHEFRTPLTVIMGMNENIEGHPKQKNLIRRNAENLLRLINQLLDLSKIDSGRMRLNMVHGDMVGYLRYLIESFQSAATDKNINLTFRSDLEEIQMDYDEVQIQHVAYNLLSNALKFTENGGQINVRVTAPNGTRLVLEVQDTGVGIDKQDLNAVFDRFYQADSGSTRKAEGTGIGLALTKEIVDLLGGDISASSQIGKGTIFTIELPIRHESQQLAEVKALDAEPVQVGVHESNGTPSQDSELPLLLLVEDNEDVATYIGDIVKNQYQFVHAPDGARGVERALELIPDIIISDVMMPNKDGYELTEELKNDERTSHVPIILLTAKTQQEEKVHGLRKGADAYLNKPFDKEELFVRLDKLVALRRTLVEKFKGTSPEDLARKTEPTVEEKFLQKVTALIVENMGEPDFSIQVLEEGLGLSKMQLYRKLKALTDLSPTNYIRDVRLDSAKNLIHTSDLTLSEIAYEVGFSDPAYFSRAFKSKFGAAPSEARN